VTDAGLSSLFDEIDISRDDTITLDEFERAVELYPSSRLRPARPGVRTFGRVAAPPRLSPAERFAEHDENEDGMVTSDEAGEDYWETIAPFDADGNGSVDREEHEVGLREQTLAKNRKFFSDMDVNSDGQASEEEVPPALWERWKSLDVNGDNQLNEDEFMQATEPTAIDAAYDKEQEG